MKIILFECLLIGSGGFAGALCRHGLATMARQFWDTSFPIGTLIANVVGCFLVGVLIGSGQDEANRNLKLLFGVGFLGALTTFSTFEAETVTHVSEQSYGFALTNIVLNVGVGYGGSVCRHVAGEENRVKKMPR